MKIIEAVNRLDSLKPNTYTLKDKVRWLSLLDGIVYQTVIRTHKGGDGVIFEWYSEDDTQKELLIGAPYDDIYIHWLSAQIDYYNGETARHESSSAQFNALFGEWARYYNRNHIALGTKIKFF